jgi:hypothetical protein
LTAGPDGEHIDAEFALRDGDVLRCGADAHRHGLTTAAVNARVVYYEQVSQIPSQCDPK